MSEDAKLVARKLFVPQKSRMVWLTLGILATLGTVGFGLHYYIINQRFTVTGQVLYRMGTRVQRVAGAQIVVLQNKRNPLAYKSVDEFLSGKSAPATYLEQNSLYQLILARQRLLNDFVPDSYDPQSDLRLVPLGLAPLGRMDGHWWAEERLNNCSYATPGSSLNLALYAFR